MKNLFAVFCILLLVAAIGFGHEQKKQEKALGQGYLFVAPGATLYKGEMAGNFQYGGGGEINLYKGLGVGGEIGYLSSIRSMRAGVGVFSVNGLYSFKIDRRDKLVPFITGGYSMRCRHRFEDAINFGGGINYWLSDKIGLRIEIRDYFHPKHLETHMVQSRIGIAFR